MNQIRTSCDVQLAFKARRIQLPLCFIVRTQLTEMHQESGTVVHPPNPDDPFSDLFSGASTTGFEYKFTGESLVL